jgi:uncharacterized protein
MVTGEATAPAIDARRLVALALPLAVPLLMVGTFTVLGETLGDQGGYVTGFAVYWGLCGILAAVLIGRTRIGELFRDVRPRLGTRSLVGGLLLLWPPLGAIATRFIPEVGEASAAMLVTIVGVAVVNTIAEEVLWRGVYISLWPHNPWLGWVWPAFGFGAWHLAPQVIHPAATSPAVFVAASTALGLSWGWVAWRTGSLRWVSVSHVLTDASGLRNALFFLGG